jgi:disulfide bond formation protein DsbB
MIRAAALLLTAAAAAALGVAFAAEWWGGLVPCALCLVERWPWRVAIALGAAALLVPSRLLLAAAVAALLAGAALGAVHVGVEQGFWPSPLPECAAPRIGGGTIAERLASMPATPSKPCDEATYLIPAVPVSMAALNMLYALALAGGLSMFLWTQRSTR